MDMLSRIASLERAVFGKAQEEGNEPVAVGEGGSIHPPTLRGYEEVPVSFVTVGFSRNLYILRPEKFSGEPPADRLVPRGDLKPTTYRHDPAQPAWVNAQRWEDAGRPSKDADGRVLDVRGAPISDGQQFSPSRP